MVALPGSRGSNDACSAIFTGCACVMFFSTSSDNLSGQAAGSWSVFCPAPRMSNLFLSWTSWELSVLESLLVGVCIGEQCFVPLLIIGVFGLFGILSMSLSISDRSRAGFKIMFPRLFFLGFL